MGNIGLLSYQRELLKQSNAPLEQDCLDILATEKEVYRYNHIEQYCFYTLATEKEVYRDNHISLPNYGMEGDMVYARLRDKIASLTLIREKYIDVLKGKQAVADNDSQASEIMAANIFDRPKPKLR